MFRINLVLLLAILFSPTQCRDWKSFISNLDGSTLHLKEIFLGRCFDYMLNWVDNPLPGVESNCYEIWWLFKDSFAYQSSCGLGEDSYSQFLQAAGQRLPPNKSLFWSGTSDLVHRLSQKGQQYVTMEDTLVGFSVNSLNWCGKETIPGINFIKCPDWGECEGDSNSVFWDASSTWFASQAEGEVYVLLDGSTPDYPAYRSDSFFATVELPNMDPDKVRTVNVMLVIRLGHEENENCTSGTLVDLRKDVEAKGFIFRCQENPDNVMHLLCMDDPTASECESRCPVPAERTVERNYRDFRDSF